MALKVSDCEKMIEAAESAGKWLFIIKFTVLPFNE
jgi:hypothetical protein